MIELNNELVNIEFIDGLPKNVAENIYNAVHPSILPVVSQRIYCDIHVALVRNIDYVMDNPTRISVYEVCDER